MSVAELQEIEEIKLLVLKGSQTGVLTYAEVATALASGQFVNTDDTMWVMLSEMGTRIRNTLPSLGALVTVMDPFRRRSASRTSSRPIPRPPTISACP